MSIPEHTEWPGAYADVSERVVHQAPEAAPLLAGFNACVDALHEMHAARIASLAAGRDDGPRARSLVATVLDRIIAGRGGEVFVDWPGGSDWVREKLGEPERHQIGGTGPQAAWAWAALGAPAVVPLADRHRLQLDVLHPDTRVCGANGLRRIGEIAESGQPATKPRHHILEFSAGTLVPLGATGSATAGTLPRSSRIILRFAHDGIERDERFADTSTGMCSTAYAGLISGLNGLPDDERKNREWLRQLCDRWRTAGLPLIHLELAEYASVAALRRVPPEYAGAVHSLGMSLSERSLLGTEIPSDPAEVVRDLAVEHRLQRITVHADDWALSVHHTTNADRTGFDAASERNALLTGNLLAAARAANGFPVAEPTAPVDATYTEDRPVSRALGDGWYVECVPAPYLPRPTSTIGLGDTFVAGLLLAPSLRTPGRSTEQAPHQPVGHDHRRPRP